MASSATFGRRRTGKFGIVHGGREREIAVAQLVAGLEQDVALPKINAGAADVASGDRRFGDGNAVALDDGVFLNDHGVGPVRNDAAGKDAHRFARVDDAIEGPAGRDLTNDLEPGSGTGSIRCTHRIAVHGRHRLGRLGAERREVARQDPLVSRIQRDHLFGHRIGAERTAASASATGIRAKIKLRERPGSQSTS